MRVIAEEGSRPIKAWTEDIEEAALQQAKNLARLPFIAGNGIALMPDVHAGIGSTVGSVIATDKAVIPAAVGVDIGCGMNAVRLSLTASDLPDSLRDLRLQIERDVPTGFNQHQRRETIDAMALRIPEPPQPVMDAEPRGLVKAAPQLGTLGGGNHFIELCLDESGSVWVMLHSGSRGIGNAIGRRYIEIAKKEAERWMLRLPDPDLAYLPEGSEHFESYMQAVGWAQNYARENRAVMMKSVIGAIRRHITVPFTITQEAINCHHNYVERESHFGRNMWVTRKGAIRAREGDLGIIPGSMGQRSYIVCGKGHPESYCSCSHGAGRKMSRTAAKKLFTVDDLAAQTEGVECRKDAAVIDEIPGAYKSIDEVMANQADLVEVRHTLKQVLCVKGG